MRICFIIPKAYTFFNRNVREIIGGSEAAFYHIARQLATYRDIQVSFIVADYGQAEEERSEGIRLIRSFKFGDNFFRQVFDFLRAVRRSRADIFVQRTLTPMSGPLAVLFKLMRKKFIYMIACDHEVDGRYERSYAGPVSAFLSLLVFRYAALVIAQNDIQREYLRRWHVRSPAILKSGITVKDFDKHDNGTVLWVHRSVQHKRPFILLEMARKHPSIKFIMISSGDDDKNPFHKKVADGAREIPNVTFIDYVPFRDIDDYFRQARVFVNTSSMEGFPFAFIQAMAAKTPIVSLEINPDNVLDTCACGIPCKGVRAMMEQKIIEVCSDDALFRRMSDNAFRCIRQEHDVVLVTRAFIELIK